MGYSGRYHAASLAAVFLALGVGILIGVGFGSDVVSGTADDLERSLSSDLDRKQAEIDDLEDQLAGERELGAALAPAVVANRLRGREIAIVAFGELDETLTDEVRAALEPAGATLKEIAVVREPPDVAAAIATVERRPSRDESRDEALTRVASLAGEALVVGGGRFDELRAALFSRYSGNPGGLDGVVVVRQQPEGLSDREASDTALIEDGIIQGAQEARAGQFGQPLVTVVGAESTATDPSSIAFFAEHDAANVDNLDQLAGKVALVYALDGAEGEFGVKETADALLPDLLAPVGLAAGAGDAG